MNIGSGHGKDFNTNQQLQLWEMVAFSHCLLIFFPSSICKPFLQFKESQWSLLVFVLLSFLFLTLCPNISHVTPAGHN